MGRSTLQVATLSLFGALLSTAAVAAERFQVSAHVLINAPAQAVWEIMGAFDELHQWHPAVSASEISVGQVPQRGAIRRLTLGEGEVLIDETLTAYSDEQTQYSYVINGFPQGSLPLADYAATVRVVPLGDDLSLAMWRGDFLATVGPEEDGEQARQLIDGFYRAGLDALRQMVEGPTQEGPSALDPTASQEPSQQQDEAPPEIAPAADQGQTTAQEDQPQGDSAQEHNSPEGESVPATEGDTTADLAGDAPSQSEQEAPTSSASD